MKLVLATRNPGKLREFARLLDGAGVELIDLSHFPATDEVVEDADTYLGNARAKALSAMRHTRLAALADDSGLEVDALRGGPGVRSARFAADAPDRAGGGDRANNDLLLERLAGTTGSARSARFRCTLVVVTPDRRELVADGTCEGLIADQPRGSNGFGYDPIFYHPASAATFAEIDADRKLRCSHRAAACAQIAPSLAGFLAPPQAPKAARQTCKGGEEQQKAKS